jgi:hypothetical protein
LGNHEKASNKRVQSTLHKVSGPLTPDVGTQTAMNHEWTVAIVGGVISSLIAAGILSLFTNSTTPTASGPQIMMRVLKVMFIAVIMIPVTSMFFSDELEHAFTHWGDATSFLIRGSIVLLIAVALVAVVIFGVDPNKWFDPPD